MGLGANLVLIFISCSLSVPVFFCQHPRRRKRDTALTANLIIATAPSSVKPLFMPTAPFPKLYEISPVLCPCLPLKAIQPVSPLYTAIQTYQPDFPRFVSAAQADQPGFPRFVSAAQADWPGFPRFVSAAQTDQPGFIQPADNIRQNIHIALTMV